MSQKKSELHPWLATLIANGPLPLILLALWPIGYLIDTYLDDYYARIVMLIGFNVILAVSLQLINGFSGQFSLGHAGFMAVGAYMAAYPAKVYSQRFANPAGELLFYGALGIVAAIAGTVLYGLFSLIRLTRKMHSSLPALLMIGVFVWLIADVWAASGKEQTPGWLLWSKSFDMISRAFGSMIESGLPTAAKLSAWIPEMLRPPISFLVLVIGSASCAAAMGFVVGLPALRLRGDYLAIATLGMAEILRIVIQNSQPLGGALGLTGIPHYTDFTWLYGFAVVTTFVIWRIAYSAQGRAIIAVREDEVAASAIGISTTGRKVLAFVVGAFFGGAAGALFALFDRSINPSYFNMAKSIEVVVMVTLGGLGSISGAILAAAILTILPEWLRSPPSLWPWGWVVGLLACGATYAIARWRNTQWKAPVLTILIVMGSWEIVRALAVAFSVDLSQLRMVIYSLALVMMMLLRPQGLLGGRELWPRRWLSYRKMPTPVEDRQSDQPVPIS